ncbi:hypothetical protein DRN58_09670 [Thermococci archaeon]|nr:MAG: hypothetical protein DRN58_09670 [Thermococci archaeon]
MKLPPFIVWLYKLPRKIVHAPRWAYEMFIGYFLILFGGLCGEVFGRGIALIFGICALFVVLHSLYLTEEGMS